MLSTPPQSSDMELFRFPGFFLQNVSLQKLLWPQMHFRIPRKSVCCVGVSECDNLSVVYGHLAEKSKARTRANECFERFVTVFEATPNGIKINSSNISKSYFFLRRKNEASINNDGRGSLRLVKLPNSFSTLIVSLACLQQFADRVDSSRIFWSISPAWLVYRRRRRWRAPDQEKPFGDFGQLTVCLLKVIFRRLMFVNIRIWLWLLRSHCLEARMFFQR